MNTLFATVSAYVAVGLLLVGGITHSANPRAFRSFVSRQALWPAWLAAPVVAVVITVELILGVGGIAVLADWAPLGGPPAMRVLVAGW